MTQLAVGAVGLLALVVIILLKMSSNTPKPVVQSGIIETVDEALIAQYKSQLSALLHEEDKMESLRKQLEAMVSADVVHAPSSVHHETTQHATGSRTQMLHELAERLPRHLSFDARLKTLKEEAQDSVNQLTSLLHKFKKESISSSSQLESLTQQFNNKKRIVESLQAVHARIAEIQVNREKQKDQMKTVSLRLGTVDEELSRKSQTQRTVLQRQETATDTLKRLQKDLQSTQTELEPAIRQRDSIHTQIQAKIQQIANYGLKIKELKDNIEKMVNEIRGLELTEQEVLNLETLRGELDSSLAKQAEESQRINSLKNRYLTALAGLESMVSSTPEEKEALANSKKSLQEKLDSLSESVPASPPSTQRQKDEPLPEYSAGQQMLKKTILSKKTSKSSELATLRLQLQKIEAEEHVVTEELSTLEHRYRDIRISIDKMNQQLPSLKSQIESTSHDLRSYATELDGINSALSSLEQRKKELVGELVRLEQGEESAYGKLRTEEQQLFESIAKYDAILSESALKLNQSLNTLSLWLHEFDSIVNRGQELLKSLTQQQLVAESDRLAVQALIKHLAVEPAVTATVTSSGGVSNRHDTSTTYRTGEL
eukprot:GILJ01010763.1.p1 GENE.GILJ01010763.1~~GILJ01010763.1.p1  ORF type:complete len:660 (-),score=142.79 GILJ01010763.1:78-1880(-)